MYKFIPDGSVVEISDNAFGFKYMCHTPPIGYGINSMTGELQKTDILKRSDIPEEQFWQRIQLPDDYKKKRKIEEERQKINKNYFDYTLEDFRRKDWNRRLCGVWFWRYNPHKKESELIYITGQHYLYINWWVYQGKLMNYREPDRETFYVALYCQEDPYCLGLNELTQRKSGKTGRSGCVAYERTSRLANHHCGIQSKGDEDGQQMFKKSVIHPWRKLPHFYRPVYDLLKGDDPNELRFFATSRRGQNAEDGDPEEALESFIDYGTAEAGYYDGPELHTYISDETGKTRRSVSIKERARVTREATEIGGEILGFHWSTTTVEVEDKEEENEEFQEFTNQSNPLDKDSNGMTISGYYTLFQPAYKYMYFDDYGFPDEERAKDFIINRRKKLEEEGDVRGLSSYKRKKPMTFKEAFSIDGKTSLFNPELVNEQLDFVSWHNNLIEKGDLLWEDGIPFQIEKEVGGKKQLILNKLYWRPNINGKFEKIKGWWPKEPNAVYEYNGQFLPNNNFAFRVGCDPFKYDKTKDKRRSNCVAYGYQIPDDLDLENIYSDSPCIWYDDRPESTRLANEAVLKLCWLCGCQVLFERNVNHWKRDFTDWNCAGFLMWMPMEVEPGINTDGKGTVTQSICNYSEAYINKSIKKVLSKKLLGKESGWLGFKVEDTQQSDHVMAFGFTLIAVNGVRYRKKESLVLDINDVMPLNVCNY